MKQTIYYIAGAGRSGSTLFDISLGNLHNAFSLGELIFFTQNGIKDNEFCSCGKRVKECELWSDIIIEWENQKKLSTESFISVQKELTRNKRTLFNIFYYLFPKKRHLDYISDVALLYCILFEKTKKPILIDSSKNAQYILILRKLPHDFKVLHLTRKFSGVLNSAKKELKKNPKEGLEKDLKPMRFHYILGIWLVDNLLSFTYALGFPYKRIKYESFVKNPLETINAIQSIDSDQIPLFKNKGPLKAHHLVAGNKMRMADDIFVETTRQMVWQKNIKGWQKMTAKCIDFFY